MSAPFLRLRLRLVRLRLVLNHQLRMAVFPTGPQPRVPLGSVPRRTSTAGARSHWTLPDLNTQHTTRQHDKHTIHNTQPQRQTDKPQSQPQQKTQTQPQTHKHNHNTHNHKHSQKHSHKRTTNWRPWRQGSTLDANRRSWRRSKETIPEDPQAKSKTTRPTTMATCFSPRVKTNK